MMLAGQRDIQLFSMAEAWELMNDDVSRSSHVVFDQLYKSEDAEKWFALHLSSIDCFNWCFMFFFWII